MKAVWKSKGCLRGMIRAAAAAAATLGLGASMLPAQILPDEQARRLLEDGRSAIRQGKLKQALDNLNTIVTGFANTDVVDDALLEIGQAHFRLGDDIEKARAAFGEVARRYPQGNAAAGAFYYLGWLTLRNAATRAQVEEALAQFSRLCRLYPKSEWVPRALHASGLAHRRAGRHAECVQFQRRVVFEYPRDDVAPAAQYEVGRCLALGGKPAQALEEYQRLRNQHPAGEWGVRALDRTTALWRLYGGETPSFTLDPGFAFTAGNVTKNVRDMLMTEDGVLWIASSKAGSVAAFADGRMSQSLSLMKPQALAFSAQGDLIAAGESAVRVGSRDIHTFAVPDDREEMKPLDRISAALLLMNGEWLVSDLRHKAIFRFDPEHKLLDRFGGRSERVVSRLLLDDEGAVVVLDQRERCVEFFDPSGQRLRRIDLKGAGFDLRRVVDMAIDPQRNLNILDERSGVWILTPEGRLLASIGGDSLGKPQALALSPDGAILVYDGKLDRVVRFQ
ncbi:MAG: tetratricopeptide repeat protein [Vicinamibacteria bacterium]|nr:tetratricopeptide repeat protein [Vicinamibacteria bacterium]